MSMLWGKRLLKTQLYLFLVSTCSQNRHCVKVPFLFSNIKPILRFIGAFPKPIRKSRCVPIAIGLYYYGVNISGFWRYMGNFQMFFLRVLPLQRYIVVDTGNNYTITTRHHHHIFKTRPRTTFSSKLPNHNFVNIWNEIDENLKLCSSKVMFKQLLCKRYTALYLSHVNCLNRSCLECFGQNM